MSVWRAFDGTARCPSTVNLMLVTHDAPVALHVAALPSQPGRAHAPQAIHGAAHASTGAKTPLRSTKTIKVKAGDSAYSIAQANSSTVAAIIKANPKTQVRRLVPGTSLKVPVPDAPRAKSTPKPSDPKPATTKPTAPAPTAPKAAAATSAPGRHITVRPGDTLTTIAKREHVSLAELRHSNPGLDTRHLHVGASLNIATATPKPADPATPPTSTPPTVYAPKPTHVPHYAGTAAAGHYPAALVASGDRHRDQLAKANLPTQSEIQHMIVETAKRYGVDPTLALSIGWQESGHRQSAVSVCDAIGTMQVMPETGRWAGGLVHQNLDLMHAQQNITAGVIVLRYLTQNASSTDQAIASYYQGLGAVRQHGLYSDTKQYVSSVKAHMKRFAQH